MRAAWPGRSLPSFFFSAVPPRRRGVSGHQDAPVGATRSTEACASGRPARPALRAINRRVSSGRDARPLVPLLRHRPQDGTGGRTAPAETSSTPPVREVRHIASKGLSKAIDDIQKFSREALRWLRIDYESYVKISAPPACLSTLTPSAARLPTPSTLSVCFGKCCCACLVQSCCWAMNE